MKKWTKILCLMMIVVTVISMMSMTAFAAEEDVIDENFYGVEIPPEEESASDETLTPPEETNESVEAGESVTEDTLTDITDETTEQENGTDKKDDAFSVDGNGEVLDNVMDEKSGKEFYTIVTANNNNTYYLIIDHASSTKNVYMLSMIDENDLKEFLSEEEPEVSEDTGKTPTVDFGEDTKDEEPSGDDKQEEPKKDNNVLGTVLIILALGAVAGGVYFYFKIYKPKKEAQIADEDMEYVDDGVTVNEDDVSENEDVNADTYVDELTFDDEETETYEE